MENFSIHVRITQMLETSHNTIVSVFLGLYLFTLRKRFSRNFKLCFNVKTENHERNNKKRTRQKIKKFKLKKITWSPT